ncbi:hypothetical protein NRZ30_01965 [Aeromonas jandaei]|uniref:hypothetical protein n=1 Tax=Aeromonas jandaei TaxID=650 RepID=UPI00227C0922|nr:hypothetical protein [Aeromonas jandaei]WAG07850.1 hypothetical protein NRZ30_01965 [Aeromonas jandaei]
MEHLSYWFPALTTTAVFSGVLWLARSLISTRLTNSVKSEFESKLEFLRSELKAKELQIESLRSGAMSGLITRQAALYQRKLEAIDQIWDSVKELDKAKHCSTAIATLNFESCLTVSTKNPKFRDFIEKIGGDFDLKSLDLSGANLARPFITPLAWAYYSAFLAIITSAVIKMQILKVGMEKADVILKSDYPQKLIKTVLPLRAKYLDENGDSVHHFLLDEIEQLLLLELKNIQDGNEVDKDNAQRAAAINKEVERLTREINGMNAGT